MRIAITLICIQNVHIAIEVIVDFVDLGIASRTRCHVKYRYYFCEGTSSSTTRHYHTYLTHTVLASSRLGIEQGNCKID